MLLDGPHSYKVTGMVFSLEEGFSKAANSYDGERRMLVPCFDQFYGVAVDATGLHRGEGASILDLGAGTGLFAGLVAERIPDAHFTLVDLSEEMLEKAAVRFRDMGIQEPDLIVGDYSTLPLGGPYDAVISSLSIHHLDDAQKQDLIGRIFDALKPGGRFVNADQVLGETPEVDAADHRWWECSARALGATEPMIESAKARMTHDKCAVVQAQLIWMAEVGFISVSRLYQDHIFAVMAGRKPVEE